jgi:hypothetical protein
VPENIQFSFSCRFLHNKNAQFNLEYMGPFTLFTPIYVVPAATYNVFPNTGQKSNMFCIFVVPPGVPSLKSTSVGRRKKKEDSEITLRDGVI